MSDIYPAQVINQDALRWINFFNGRLLTGDDLTREQAANRDARQRLGQALGDGVAWGLQVKAAQGAIAVQVNAGEAVNRLGQVLYLSQAQSVSLLEAPKTTGMVRARQFNACEQAGSGIYGSDAGLYLLALCPGESVEDRAVLSGLSSAAAACNSKYRVEGVQFKLILLPAMGNTADPGFRNQTAFEEFIEADMTALSLQDPFDTPNVSRGRLDGLRPDTLTDEDVPLAVILRDPLGIVYADNWSVRRRVRINANEPHIPWHLFVSDRRRGEAEAAFMQFQEQLTDILRNEAESVSIMSAADRFKYLPPVGFLPVGGDYGFNWRKFLGSHAPAQATAVDAGLLGKILLEGMQCEPFQVEASQLVPVDVFIIKDDPSFVLFARTTEGRLRLEIDAGIERIDEEYSKKIAAEIEEELLRLRRELAETIDRAEDKDDPAVIEAATRFAEAQREQMEKDANGESVQDVLGQQDESAGKASKREAYLTIHSSNSNLEIRAVADEDGTVISPNLCPGVYRVIGRLPGQGHFTKGNVEIFGGQISTSQIPASLLRAGDLFLDAGYIRLCLIPGTFSDAAKQTETKPWMKMVEIGGKTPGKCSGDVEKIKQYLTTATGILKTDLLIRLIIWRRMLRIRFPDLDIRTARPKLFVNGEYNRPAVDLPKSRKLQSLPEIPQAYVVFGDLGLPLTISYLKKEASDLTILADAKEPLQINRVGFRDLTLYGMLTADQIAGAWVQVIVEATGLTSRNARVQIIRAIQYLADKNA
jgi:hypothetical protein